jgi:hypothetical protein
MRREQQAKRKQAETEENRSCKGVACFSLVEADLNPSAQRGILKPVQSEQRALDTTQTNLKLSRLNIQHWRQAGGNHTNWSFSQFTS